MLRSLKSCNRLTEFLVRRSGLSHPDGSLTLSTFCSRCRILLEDMLHTNSSEHQNYSSWSTLLRCSVRAYLKTELGIMLIQIPSGNIMTEFEYPECTTSVVTALAIFKKRYPTYRSQEINVVTAKAIEYLHNAQYSHGGWFGSWGICFTYATMFALESLSLVGETYSTSPAARKACEFLVSKQREDGGWGESYKVSKTVQ